MPRPYGSGVRAALQRPWRTSSSPRDAARDRRIPGDRRLARRRRSSHLAPGAIDFTRRTPPHSSSRCTSPRTSRCTFRCTFRALSTVELEQTMDQLRQEVEPAEVGLDPAALDVSTGYFARRVDDGRLPGYLVSVARHGRVAHLTTYGLRDREAGLPVEAGHAVADLLDDQAGRLRRRADAPGGGRCSTRRPGRPPSAGLRRPAGYVERTRRRTSGRAPPTGPILIRHLLTHTAGLTFGFYHAHPVDALVPGRRGGVGRRRRTRTWPRPARCTRACRSSSSRGPSGTTRSPPTSSAGSIEVVSGQPLDAFLAERIFGPLGMTDAGFWVPGSGRTGWPCSTGG